MNVIATTKPHAKFYPRSNQDIAMRSRLQFKKSKQKGRIYPWKIQRSEFYYYKSKLSFELSDEIDRMKNFELHMGENKHDHPSSV